MALAAKRDHSIHLAINFFDTRFRPLSLYVRIIENRFHLEEEREVPIVSMESISGPDGLGDSFFFPDFSDEPLSNR